MPADCLARWAIGAHPLNHSTPTMNQSNLTFEDRERIAYITGHSLAFAADDLEDAIPENEYERIAQEYVGIDAPKDLTAALDELGRLKERSADLENLIERIASALIYVPASGTRKQLVHDLEDMAKAIEDVAGHMDLYSGGLFANRLSLILTNKPY